MASVQPSLPEDKLSLRNMLIVSAALTVLLLRATQIFGLHVLAMAAVSFAFAFGVDILFARVRKLEMDKRWMVTPLIFTLLLPPATPLWMVAVGSSFGVFFGKAVFGGFGKNVFNPAVVGRLFLSFAFPQYMITRWLNPITGDVISGATPLNILTRGIAFPYTRVELLMGNIPGTLGETFRLGIIILGIALIVLRISDWRIPLSFIGTVFAVNFVGRMFSPDNFSDPVLSLLVGGLLLGAFFLATDPVTAPYTANGKFIYGLGLGIITVLIRNFANHNEGVMFAIIIMNAAAPLLDNIKALRDSEEVSA